MKLIQTKDYLLLIDEEAEMKHCNPINICHAHKSKPCDKCHRIEGIPVLGHYPLTKEAKELDLPLLPNPFEDIIELLATNYITNPYFTSDVNNIERDRIKQQFAKMGFIDGYKAAQSKQFSLEDIKKAIEMAQQESWDEGEYLGLEYEPEQIIQSLSTQRVPKEFVPEYENVDVCELVDMDGNYNGEDIKRLKTITNSEGKQELVGIYKY